MNLLKNVVRLNRKWEMQYGGIQTGSTYINACIDKIGTKVQRLYI